MDAFELSSAFYPFIFYSPVTRLTCAKHTMKRTLGERNTTALKNKPMSIHLLSKGNWKATAVSLSSFQKAAVAVGKNLTEHLGQLVLVSGLSLEIINGPEQNRSKHGDCGWGLSLQVNFGVRLIWSRHGHDWLFLWEGTFYLFMNIFFSELEFSLPWPTNVKPSAHTPAVLDKTDHTTWAGML